MNLLYKGRGNDDVLLEKERIMLMAGIRELSSKKGDSSFIWGEWDRKRGIRMIFLVFIRKNRVEKSIFCININRAGCSGCIREHLYCLVNHLDKGAEIKLLANA